VGVFCGHRIARWMPEKLFERLLLLFTAIGALKLIL